MSPPNKGQGAAIKFLRKHVSYSGDDCLIWPFNRAKPHGYGTLGFNGRPHRAHRLMCELAHGAPPTPKHQAAHSCGKGHLGCVNPRHLSWKTEAENQYDRHLHGTNRKKGTPRYKLTWQKVAKIRALEGKMSQQAIARKFGVTHGLISKVLLRRIWVRPHRAGHAIPKDRRPAMALKARQLFEAGVTLEKIAVQIGVAPRTAKTLAAEAGAAVPNR